MIEKLKLNSRRYAKRQITWFKKNKQIIWLEVTDNKKNIEKNIKTILKEINK